MKSRCASGFGTASQAASAARSARVCSSWPASADGLFHQCFNAQAVVDAEHQVIVAANLNDCASDMGNLIPLTEQAHSNSGVAPVQVLADAGYCSADNLKSCPGVDHGARHPVLDRYRAALLTLPACKRGRIPADFTATGWAAR